MQIALFDTVISHRRKRLLNLLFQARFQRGQVFALAQRFVFIIDNAERHFEMIGHLIPLPVFA
ncbi:hypothetical protein SRABI106_01996 [Rahnella aquatilis]|nr:hypothetical protein SRABI106_01996 [Rahnella aquatilis]